MYGPVASTFPGGEASCAEEIGVMLPQQGQEDKLAESKLLMSWVIRGWCYVASAGAGRLTSRIKGINMSCMGNQRW